MALRVDERQGACSHAICATHLHCFTEAEWSGGSTELSRRYQSGGERIVALSSPQNMKGRVPETEDAVLKA